MKAPGESIGSYRILSIITTTPSYLIYMVDRTEKSSMAAILTVWTAVSLTAENDRSTFLKQAAAGSLYYNDTSIPILNEGIEGRHPYIILPYHPTNVTIAREHANHIDQVLSQTQTQNNTAEMDIDSDGEDINKAFLSAFAGTLSFEEAQDTPTDPSHPRVSAEAANINTVSFSPRNRSFYQEVQQEQTAQAAAEPTVPYSKYQPQTHPPRSRRRWLLIPAIILVLLLLFLAIFGRSTVYLIIPAASATITLTPTRPELKLTYNFSVVMHTPDSPNQVQGRSIAFSSSQLTKTVDASGQGQTKATTAKGSIVLSQINFNDNAASRTLGIVQLSANDGTSITTDEEVEMTQGGTVTIPAHATTAGSGGNIAADSLDGPVDLYNSLTNVQDGTGYVANPNAFSGGTDATPFTFVQQADIDGVTKPFAKQVTTGLRQKVLQQLKAGEKLVTDVQCDSAISSNHRALDHATNVTVKDRVTCHAIAYNEPMLRTTTLQTYQRDGITNVGQGYAVVGAINMGLFSGTAGANGNPAQLSVNVDAIWSYQYGQAQKQALASALIGKPQSQAQQILRSRHDIEHATISTQGFFGNAMPFSPASITIVVQKVTGLT